jgi:hypothetical protein
VPAALYATAKYEIGSIRLAAWINALKRIEEAVKMRG